jgi:antiviral helicase SKI2
MFNNPLDDCVQHLHLLMYFSQEDIIPVLKITQTAPLRRKMQTQWAEELDVSCPVRDFEKKVPVMAKTWPFELDTFQKQVSYR